MAAADYLFTSESVAEGHPDKVCDRISDTIVDAYLAAMPEARVACETLATTNRVVIAGEVRGPDAVLGRIEDLTRQAIHDIGYDQAGFHWQTAQIEVLLHAQSADIARGVDAAGNKDEGAGDQGIMFGYACRETPELMPAPIYYAHQILKRLATARHSGEAPMLGPDAKSQVTIKYVDGKPIGVTSLVVSTQHLDDQLSSDDVREIVAPFVGETLPRGGSTASPNGTSIRPASSSLAARTAMPASPGARSSSTRTVAPRGTVAAPSRARIRRRSTARRRMPRATWRRTSSRRGWRRGARSRWRTRSASRIRSRSSSTPSAPRRRG